MVKPQQLQRFEDGKNRSIATTERPAHSPLYRSWRVNSPQPASAIALDNDGLRSMFFTFRDSTQTTWFSFISLRDALCRASRRQSAIFAWSRATFKRALARFFEPLAFLLKRRWSCARRAAYLAVWRGLPDLNPVSVTNKSFKPTSIPTVLAVIGSDTGSNSQRQETKYRPATSLERVTVDGVDGNSRLQRTSKGALLFAIYSLPLRYLNALAVNSAACLWRLLLNAGYAARPAKKLVKAVCWWRSDCCSGTQETSLIQANSGSFSVLLVGRWPGRSPFSPSVRCRHQCASEGLNCRRNAHSRTSGPEAQPARALDRIEIYMRVSWFRKIRTIMRGLLIVIKYTVFMHENRLHSSLTSIGGGSWGHIDEQKTLFDLCSSGGY